MRPRTISEAEHQEMVDRVKASSVGVKEHTPNGGRGGGAVSDRQSGTAVKSSARTSQTTNGYKSKLEETFAYRLVLERAGGEIANFWYEPLNLRLPGGKNFYKPDFLVLAGDGLTFYEIKGRNKSDDRSLVKIKTAAGLTPWAKFILVKWIGGQWDERTIA